MNSSRRLSRIGTNPARTSSWARHIISVCRTANPALDGLPKDRVCPSSKVVFIDETCSVVIGNRRRS
jgi:hypothetical protein